MWHMRDSVPLMALFVTDKNSTRNGGFDGNEFCVGLHEGYDCIQLHIDHQIPLNCQACKHWPILLSLHV